LSGKKILLATSGGKDSMVILHLFQHLIIEWELHIVIFSCVEWKVLKTKFVQEYASANDIPVFITQFDTKALQKILKSLLASCRRELRLTGLWY
jgi:tRNA(Ile)-lysidine synthase